MYSKSSMKRDRDRDGSPVMNKRSRSSLGRYDQDSSDGGTPPERRRRADHSPPPPVTSRRGYDDYRGSGGSAYKDVGSSRSFPYKVLCISSLHSKASDEVVRETLYREFKRFGDISVKVVHEPDERVAYVYFRSYEDARDAKHSKSRIIIYDKPVMVEAAYESVPTGTSASSGAGGSSSRYNDGYSGSVSGSGGDRGGYYRRSPMYEPRSHRDEHHEPHGRSGGRTYERGTNFAHHHPPHAPPLQPGGPYPLRTHDGGYGRREPPMHHHDQHGPGYMGHPRGMGGHYGRYANGPPGMPRQPEGQRLYENKKDKFPNYLHHIPPEEDPLATRTLFAGNLEVNISDEELRQIFGRFGTVEDIDIKRPPPGTGNAYAFVRFVNLDMAARAKTELSGQYIGKFQCKIGYGKVNPTNRIWIGGLGPWTTMAQLEREFDRFGSIKKIDWVKNEPSCYITFETVDAAQAAVKDMRGYPLGGSDKRLRTDFADNGGFPPPKKYPDDDATSGAGDSALTQPLPPASGHSTDINTSPSDTESREGSRRRSNGNSTSGGLASAKNVFDISRKVPIGWTGSLILKNSSFSSKMYMTSGDLESVEGLMKDEEGKNQLRITQRLRLDQAKLDDVMKRITMSSSHGVFLAMPASISSPQDAESGGLVQSRPLRNLMQYLKLKEAAGVVSLAGKDATGVLYAFPPCAFSTELLGRGCPSLDADIKEDHLVVVVIRGSASADEMESPLDILSRAAGMVSRSNTESSSASSTSSRKPENSNSNSSTSSTISVTSDPIPRTDNQCRILKLALVSSAPTTPPPGGILPPKISPPIPAIPQNLALNGNGHYIKSEDNIRPVDDDLPVNLGKRPVLSPGSSPSRKREANLNLDSDPDRPLDFSMKKLSNKRVKDDSDSDEGEGPVYRQHSWRDFKMKRKRPSVISYASQAQQNQYHAYPSPENLTHQPLKPKYPNIVRDESDALDVDDHFKKSLGLEFYNSVFSADKRNTESKPDEVPAPRSPPVMVDVKPYKSSANSQDVPVKESKREVKVEQPSAVDDHFEKALGKSTWLKLKGL